MAAHAEVLAPRSWTATIRVQPGRKSLQTVTEAIGPRFAEASSEDVAKPNAAKLRVFISYSRKDAPFVDRLAKALEARDIEVFVDRRDLPFLTTWQDELVASIAASDAVVYVISPAAAESAWCQWEVNQVVNLKKRLAPVVAAATPVEALPEAVRAIQLLPMTEDVDFDRQSDILAKALKTDLRWIKEHTRIAERAYRWETSGRPDAALLRGPELADAELWISSRPRDAPEPTVLHREFVQESRLGEQGRMASEREQLDRTRRLQRRFAWALSAFSALVLTALIAVLWQTRSTFTREALVFASQAEQAWDRDECDRSARYALAGLPNTKSNPLTPWSPILEASLVRALWPCRLITRFAVANQQLYSARFSMDGKQVLISAGKEAVIMGLAWGNPIRRLADHTDEINDASFSEDGQRVLTASSDGTVRVWNAATGSEQLRLSVSDGEPVRTRFLSADMLIVSFNSTEAGKGLLQTWDASTGTGQGKIVTGSALFGDAQAFVTHGSWVVTRVDDKAVAVWDVSTSQKVVEVPGDDIQVLAAAFSPGGDRIIVGGSSHQAHVWNLAERKQIAELRGHENAVEVAAFSPDGQRIVTGSWDGTAKIWNATSGGIERNLAGHGGVVVCVAFSPDGALVVTASRDATVRIWDSRTGQPLGLMKGHDGPIRSCALTRDGTRAVTLSGDQTVRVWDTTRGHDILQLGGHTRWARSVAFSPDGKELATSSDDGTLRVWNADGHPIKLITTGTRSIEQLQFSPNGKGILTADGTATASLWDIESGQLVGRFVGHSGVVRSAAMSSDGSRVVTASGSELGEGDKTARIWDAVSRRELLRLEGHEDDVLFAAFSPNGKLVVTGGGDKTARIWDATTGALLKSLEGHGGAVYAVAFSPDGRLVVTGSADRAARIWEVATGRQRMTLKGHGGWVTSVSFNPEASRVLTAGPDNTARIWDVNTGIEVARLTSHGDAVRAAAFSPDGQRVATVGDGPTVQIWDVAFASIVHGPGVRTEACRRLAGATEFTDTEMLNPIFRSGNTTRDVCTGAGKVSIEALWR